MAAIAASSGSSRVQAFAKGPRPAELQRGRVTVSTREKQARITIRIEAITGLNRMGVGRLHGVETHERADQHEQGRARQVKVGDQSVDRLEVVARGDEDCRIAL